MSDDVTAAFNLSVESNAAQISRDGAEGLANLQERMQGSVEELRNLNAAFRSLKSGAGVSSVALAELQQRIGAQKSAIASQQQAYLKAGGTFKELAERNKVRAAQESVAARAKLDAEKHQAKASKDAQKLTKNDIALGTVLGGVYVMLAVKAAQLAGGVMRAAKGLFAFGIAAADARRSELLQLEGLTKIRHGLWYLGAGYQIAADKAGFLQEQIDNVAGSSALSRDKVSEYASQLYKTGLRAGNLQAALEAMTITGSTQGDGQAQIFASMAAGARMAGVSVKKLSDDVKARLGGIAAAQTLSLSVQLQKLHESFSMLFTGLKIEPLLNGVKKIADLFKLNTAEGRALKDLLTDMFQPLIDAAPTLALVVKRAFQGIIIGALMLDNAFLDLQISYYAVFGPSKPVKNAELLKLAVEGCAAAVIGFTGAAVLGAAAIAAIFIAPIALGAAAGAAVAKIEIAFNKLSATAQGIGKGFIDGIVSGIVGGIPSLIMGVGKAGAAMITAFRDKLEIHSPSRVAFRDTQFVTKGQVAALKAGKPELEKAVRDNAASPMSGSGANAAGPAFKPGGAVSSPRAPMIFQFQAGAIQAHGDAKEADLQSAVTRALEALLPRLVLAAGGQPA